MPLAEEDLFLTNCLFGSNNSLQTCFIFLRNVIHSSKQNRCFFVCWCFVIEKKQHKICDKVQRCVEPLLEDFFWKSWEHLALHFHGHVVRRGYHVVTSNFLFRTMETLFFFLFISCFVSLVSNAFRGVVHYYSNDISQPTYIGLIECEFIVPIAKFCQMTK